MVWGEFFSILANLLLRFSLLAAFHIYSWALFILKIICACVDVCVCECHCARVCFLQPYSRHFFFCRLKGSHSASRLCFHVSGGCDGILGGLVGAPLLICNSLCDLRVSAFDLSFIPILLRIQLRNGFDDTLLWSWHLKVEAGGIRSSRSQLTV